eukprot:1147211-Pelagomonas_calceolata.AAC.5
MDSLTFTTRTHKEGKQGDAGCFTAFALSSPSFVQTGGVCSCLPTVGGVVPLLQELSAQAGAKMAQCSGGVLCSLAWALVRLQCGLRCACKHAKALRHKPRFAGTSAPFGLNAKPQSRMWFVTHKCPS